MPLCPDFIDQLSLRQMPIVGVSLQHRTLPATMSSPSGIMRETKHPGFHDGFSLLPAVMLGKSLRWVDLSAASVPSRKLHRLQCTSAHPSWVRTGRLQVRSMPRAARSDENIRARCEDSMYAASMWSSAKHI